MKIRKLAAAFVAAAGLMLSASGLMASVGLQPTTVYAAEPETEAGTATIADGWHSDQTGVFYTKGGKRLTGRQTISGAVYYFNDQTGYRVTGIVKIGENLYLFSPVDGRLYTDRNNPMVRLGQDTDTYYYINNTKGVLAVNKWVKYNGKYFYANENGQIKLGTIKINGKLYHITQDGRMISYGQSKYDGNYYYASASGVLYTGIQKVEGKNYFFNKTTGARMTGAVKVGKSNYFFSNKNGAAVTGWVKLKGKYYYYNKDYKRITGWLTLNGKKYCLPKAQNGARLSNGWYKVKKSYYYFNKKGVMQTGWITIGDKRYYAKSSGVRAHGWMPDIGGRKYFFDRETGVMQTGWTKGNGTRMLYLNPNKASSTYGAAMVGFTKIDGDWYYFKQDGGMKTGWVTENNKKYYFDPDTGKMYTGKHTIDGQTYDFGTSGAISVTATGAWSIKVKRGSYSSPECYVVVYRGGTPVKAFVCSTAKNGVSTPLGTYSIRDKLYWHELMGPSWGQYCSHVTSDILFHSVPNTQYNNPYSLETWEYNKLGSPASAGCIRLSVKHAKWLFDNVPIGTPVTISDSVPKPTNIQIEWPPKQASNLYYDPTDTFVNPYSVR